MAPAEDGSITVSFLLTGDPAQFICPLQKAVSFLAACFISPRINMENIRGLCKKWKLINTIDIKYV